MTTLLLSALLLPAVVSAWPGYSRPTTKPTFPPAFTLPPININLGGFSFSLPDGVAAYFGNPTAGTDSAAPSDSTPAPITSASPDTPPVRPTDDDVTSATNTAAPTSATTEGARPDAPSVQSPLGVSSYISRISSFGNSINGNSINGNTAGSLTVRYAKGSPSVSYNERSRSAEIRAKLILSSATRATCKLRRGNRQIVSKDCSSGSFSHTVRQEGSYTLVVEASDSNNNKVTRAQAVQVRFN